MKMLFALEKRESEHKRKCQSGEKKENIIQLSSVLHSKYVIFGA